MHCRNIHFSTIYHLLFHDITYKTLDHTHPAIVTAEERVEYIPTKKYMELERNSLLTLSSNNPEIPLENHIVYMEIPLSLIILSITPNDRMIQTSNISCGGNYHIWSHKIAKDQDWEV